MHEQFSHLGHDICHCLRYKGMFINAPPDPTVPSCHDGSYWCVMTQTVLGPDEQVVEPEGCKPGRSCYFILV